jgi:hypothetical protein
MTFECNSKEGLVSKQATKKVVARATYVPRRATTAIIRSGDDVYSGQSKRNNRANVPKMTGVNKHMSQAMFASQ